MRDALATAPLTINDLGDHLTAQRRLGVPYTDDMIANASRDAATQANPDGDTAGITERYGEATTVRQFSGTARLTEMDALVAYLQVLGQLTQVPYADDAPQVQP